MDAGEDGCWADWTFGMSSNGFLRSCPLGPARGVRSAGFQNLSMVARVEEDDDQDK